MTKRRITIVVVAVIGAVLGAVLGVLAAPKPSRFVASANVAFLPGPDLTTVEASNFWEVLTRGQITRTAAIVYNDARWLTPAADAAKVPIGELTLMAAAVPETTMLTVTVTANSAAAAEAALNSVLVTATPEVSSLAAPYFVKVLWPPKNSAYPEATPGPMQVGAAGGLGGLLVGAGVGWFVARRRYGRRLADFSPGALLPDADRDGAATQAHP
ncbi:hypothetical protein ORI20_20680 [Mycobacterium sp. CVI_P3]|uniref:Uncharacterized protein n=1 Tax=Mycobacterium pinniadriaticum TaxID=2994102 RepID=A0ABT3SHY5_9MYCO|nr:hypothetical protein [Mycobacterium pinniadriaticum]MCX2932692.1 hypothetical protein [Mycobacterium pinniadriaticum]MCX2939116.1 hypothetical protein [Mycobacterium pinniadriaticum]